MPLRGCWAGMDREGDRPGHPLWTEQQRPAGSRPRRPDRPSRPRVGGRGPGPLGSRWGSRTRPPTGPDPRPRPPQSPVVLVSSLRPNAPAAGPQPSSLPPPRRPRRRAGQARPPWAEHERGRGRQVGRQGSWGSPSLSGRSAPAQERQGSQRRPWSWGSRGGQGPGRPGPRAGRGHPSARPQGTVPSSARRAHSPAAHQGARAPPLAAGPGDVGRPAPFEGLWAGGRARCLCGSPLPSALLLLAPPAAAAAARPPASELPPAAGAAAWWALLGLALALLPRLGLARPLSGPASLSPTHLPHPAPSLLLTPRNPHPSPTPSGLAMLPLASKPPTSLSDAAAACPAAPRRRRRRRREPPALPARPAPPAGPPAHLGSPPTPRLHETPPPLPQQPRSPRRPRGPLYQTLDKPRAEDALVVVVCKGWRDGGADCGTPRSRRSAEVWVGESLFLHRVGSPQGRRWAFSPLPPIHPPVVTKEVASLALRLRSSLFFFFFPLLTHFQCL